MNNNKHFEKNQIMDKVRSMILHSLASTQNQFFDDFTKRFDDYYDNLVSSSYKRVDRERQKGLAFEELCYQMILVGAFPKLHVKHVWQYVDFPYKKEFNLPQRDEGIDLIIKTNSGCYSAVQCKYRKKPTRSSVSVKNVKQTSPQDLFASSSAYYQKRIYWSLSWRRDLATFHALCERTGPPEGWFRRVVITNAPSISWKGRKQKYDLSICRGTWMSVSKHLFGKAVGLTDHKLTKTPEKRLSPEQIRMQRLRMFSS